MITLDLHTLAVSLVNCVTNLKQTRAEDRYLSDLSLREVVNWGMILGAVVSSNVQNLTGQNLVAQNLLPQNLLGQNLR